VESNKTKFIEIKSTLVFARGGGLGGRQVEIGEDDQEVQIPSYVSNEKKLHNLETENYIFIQQIS